MQYDFVVIGSGPAGQKAAIQGAKAGKKVVMIEAEQQVGGMCVHRGTIPSKALRESALRYRNAHRLLASEAPTELAPLMENVGLVIDAHDQYISAQLDRNAIQFVVGRASFVSPHEIEVIQPTRKSLRFEADRIFIATGSVPRQPSHLHIDHEHVFDSDSILSMHYLPRSLIVLGGGVIACEYASVFASLGTEVTLIDRFPEPLGFLDQDLPKRFVAEFEAGGGRFIGSVNVKEARYDGVSEVNVVLEDGRRMTAEKLLVAQGRVSNIRGLQMGRAGVEVSDLNLIHVNEHCQTNIPHIYAVGDVIGPPSLASSSMEQGRRAACHALGIEQSRVSSTIPSGIYAIPELSSVGMTEAQARAEYGDVITGYAEFTEVARGLIAGTQDGMLKMIADPNGERLLGVHIVGEGASELIHLGQMALINETPVSAFVEQIFNFPTLAEAYRVAALSVRGQAMMRESQITTAA